MNYVTSYMSMSNAGQGMGYDVYAVRPEEHAQYHAYTVSVARQLIRPPPQTLWYYTTASTFAQILKTNSVWATQIACLNDHSEFRYSVRLFREQMKKLRDDSDEAARWLAGLAFDRLEDDGADTSEFFVLCMSLVRDDLSQWRAYGGGEGGVSIGFDVAGFVNATATNRNNTPPIPVRYDLAEHDALVTDIANATIHFFKEGLRIRPEADRQKWAESFLVTWRGYIVYFAPVLKDSSFRGESEWRLIYSLAPEDLKRVEIKQRQTLISRHLPIAFTGNLPIREVVVGPCRHPSVSRGITVTPYILPS